MTGKISNIAETLGKLSVQIEGKKEHGINLLSVQCTFPEEARADLSKLKKGDTVTLSGIGDGKTLGFYVGLNECKIQ